MKYEPVRVAAAPTFAVALLLASSAACAERAAPQAACASNSSKGDVVTQAPQQGPVSNLPFSQGRSFATLDEYLEFRRIRGTYDVPWYRRTKPGLYELVSDRGPDAEPKTYSREELARKFGFAR